ncbi:MAG: S8 family serine peptidase [Burkholderiaceae bacterium]|nr:S8 family serine peptidase [Burkholderiaceae bacterium]
MKNQVEQELVYYGTKAEGGTPLTKVDNALAIGFDPRMYSGVGELIKTQEWPCALRVVESGESGDFGVVEAVEKGGQAKLQAAKEALRRVPGVRFAANALVYPNSRTAIHYSGKLFVKFTDECDADRCMEVLRQAQLGDIQKVKYAENAYTATCKTAGRDVFEIARNLIEREDVTYSIPEITQHRESKSSVVSARVIHPKQWHLQSTEYRPGIHIDESANVIAAHAHSTGQGVTIAVIDDGVDTDHIEFSSPGKVVAPLAIKMGVFSADARPTKVNDYRVALPSHGTAVAGVACADGVHGACGVAPDAKLMPINYLNEPMGGFGDAEIFYWAASKGADVIVCSWGPPDGVWNNPDDPDHFVEHPIRPYVKLAIEYAVKKGRGGRGCAIFWAAGNGNESVDLDGLASNPDVFAIAACNEYGERSQYSDYGKAIFCAFPSNDYQPELPGRDRAKIIRTAGIWTTHILDTYDAKVWVFPKSEELRFPYYPGFGGTSSATPGAAGVAALVLSIVPSISLLDLRRLLIAACDVIDADSKEAPYDRNGHSIYYGAGRINAERAVLLAKSMADQLESRAAAG